MKIQIKLSLLIVSILVITMIATGIIGMWVINNIIYSLNTALFSLKLDQRFQAIQTSVKLLEESGVSGIDIYVKDSQQKVLNEFQTLAETHQERFYVVDSTFHLLFYPDAKQIGAKVEEPFVKEMMEKKSGTISYTYENASYFAVYRYEEQWGWLVAFSIPEAEMFYQRQVYIRTVSLFSAGVLAVLIVISYFVGKFMIVSPLRTLARAADSISAGNFQQEIRLRQRDEIGNLAKAFDSMKNSIGSVMQETSSLLASVQDGVLSQRGETEGFSGDWKALMSGVNNVLDAFAGPFHEMAAAIDRLSRGDVREMLPETYRGDFNELIRKLNSMILSLQDVAMNVQSASEQMATSSKQMSASMQSLAEGAAQQAAVAEEVSASMEEMVATIKQSSDNALQTERIALQSAAEALEASHAVTESVSAMREIAKKIAFIEEIARETHMLSLNATIEAAKAQDYGKGFGVVAAEVRSLAERSRISAEEINELTTKTMAISEEAGLKLASVVPNIQRTAELVQEISASSREHNAGAEQVNLSIQQLDQVIQHNAAMFEELANTSELLANQAQQLQETSEFFQLDYHEHEEIEHEEIEEGDDEAASLQEKKRRRLKKKALSSKKTVRRSVASKNVSSAAKSENTSSAKGRQSQPRSRRADWTANILEKKPRQIIPHVERDEYDDDFEDYDSSESEEEIF